jgi:hypothetical protein
MLNQKFAKLLQLDDESMSEPVVLRPGAERKEDTEIWKAVEAAKAWERDRVRIIVNKEKAIVSTKPKRQRKSSSPKKSR